MQSRNFFGFGAHFNILTDSVFVNQPKLDASSIPPVEGHFNLLDGTAFLLLDGTHLLLL